MFPMRPNLRLQREQDFWHHHMPTLDESLDEYAAGPDKNTSLLLDALEPLDGTAALDFACGTGVTTAWLAERGASVLGIDTAPPAISCAQKLCEKLGINATFHCGQLTDLPSPASRFQRILGRYALHHVDLMEVAPLLADMLAADGTAAFLETMSTNPLLALARRTLPGRLGIPRMGTPDEQPLNRRAITGLEHIFGDMRLDLAQMVFLRIFDRQIMAFRKRTVSYLCSWLDDHLYSYRRLHFLSYQRVLLLRHAPGLALD